MSIHPFDRLLVAQAQLEALPILTADKRLCRYDIEVMIGVSDARALAIP